MTAKEYLRRIRGLEHDLESIEEEIVRIETALTRMSPSYQTDWVNSSHSNDKIVESIDKLIQKKKEYAEAWDRLIDERQLAEKCMTLMDNRTHADILWRYYIKGRKFEYIAVKINVSYRHLMRYHGYALQEFSKIYEKLAQHVI